MPSNAAARVILSELASVGLDPKAVCAQAKVDPRAPEDDTVPFGIEDLSRVLACAEAAANDPLLGLHMAERAQGRGVLSYLARAQRTVGEGLEAFASFAGGAWGGGAGVSTEPRGERTFVGFRLARELPRHVAEYLVSRTAILLGRSGARATEVSFRHEPGGAPSEYERVLRCPVSFVRSETGIWLRSDDLARPLRTASPEAAAALAAALVRRPATPASASISERTAAAIEESLARGGGADREALARSLGMSGKTLARRLAAERLRFRDLVDDVRRTLAKRLVTEQSLDLGEIATCVGFADAAAFGKAFRRWFGESPSSFRARRTSR